MFVINCEHANYYFKFCFSVRKASEWIIKILFINTILTKKLYTILRMFRKYRSYWSFFCVSTSAWLNYQEHNRCWYSIIIIDNTSIFSIRFLQRFFLIIQNLSFLDYNIILHNPYQVFFVSKPYQNIYQLTNTVQYNRILLIGNTSDKCLVSDVINSF